MTTANTKPFDSADEAIPATGTVEATPSNARVMWDESRMAENYANVATILATQEEFSILFGIQRGLKPDPRGMQVQLTNRILVNPFLAKRLMGVLQRTLDEYERRFGPIKIEG